MARGVSNSVASPSPKRRSADTQPNFASLGIMQNRILGVPVFRPLVAVVLVVIAFELGGVWSELKGLRREQVKNAAYSMPPEQLTRLRASPSGQMRLRVLSGQSTVTVEASEPIPVKVKDSNSDPIYIQIG